MRKKLATVTAHGELTVSSRWPKWSQPAVTEPWPGPWLSCDLAVTEPWSYWRCRDWAVTSPWLSCDLAVTELWPRRDWAVTSPSRDWAVIIGPGAVTTVSSRWAHGDHLFSHGMFQQYSTQVSYIKINDQLVILLFAPKYLMKSSVFNCIQFKNKTKFGMIKSVIYLCWPILVADCCLISTSADFDAVPLIMTAWDTHSFIVINWPEAVFFIKTILVHANMLGK